jgi:hypothetical protein
MSFSFDISIVYYFFYYPFTTLCVVRVTIPLDMLDSGAEKVSAALTAARGRRIWRWRNFFEAGTPTPIGDMG